MNSAKPILTIIDYTECFASPNGALTVKEGDVIGSVIKQLTDAFEAKNLPHVFTGDAHPENHISFSSRFGLKGIAAMGDEMKRPDHSVEGTPGAGLYTPFDDGNYTRTIKKGYLTDHDSYSAFGGVTEDESQTFDEYLQNQAITDIYLTGLATDYCVGNTALDARKHELGENTDKVKSPYNVYLIVDAIRGVASESTQTMLQKLKDAGVIFTTSEEVIHKLIHQYT